MRHPFCQTVHWKCFSLTARLQIDLPELYKMTGGIQRTKRYLYIWYYGGSMTTRRIYIYDIYMTYMASLSAWLQRPIDWSGHWTGWKWRKLSSCPLENDILNLLLERLQLGISKDNDITPNHGTLWQQNRNAFQLEHFLQIYLCSPSWYLVSLQAFRKFKLWRKCHKNFLTMDQLSFLNIWGNAF